MLASPKGYTLPAALPVRARCLLEKLEQRRRRWIVDRQQQRGFIALLLVHAAVQVAAYGAMTALVAMELRSLAPGMLQDAAELRSLIIRFLLRAAVPLALFAALLVYLAVRDSGRLAGPVHRLKLMLGEIACGNLTQRAYFRKGDVIRDLVEPFNRQVAAFDEKLCRVHAERAFLLDMLAELRKAAEGNGADDGKRIAELEARIGDLAGRWAEPARTPEPEPDPEPQPALGVSSEDSPESPAAGASGAGGTPGASRRERRRSLLVNRGFQLRFTAWQLAMVTSLWVLSAANGIYLLSVAAGIVRRIGITDEIRAKALGAQLDRVIWQAGAEALGLALVSVAVTVFFGLRASHKLTGPVARLGQYLSGRLFAVESTPLVFRRTDHLDDLAAIAASAAAAVSQRRQETGRTLALLRSKLDDLKQAASGDSLRRHAEEMEALVRSLTA